MSQYHFKELKMPQISIIIPCYNVEKYINQTLDSILAQTFRDFEVICINDGSTDKTPDLLRQYADNNKQIKVINQQNSGVSKTRNNAFAHTTGKYIYYMDSDDLIHPQLLEICYDLAEKNEADVLSFGYEEFFDGQQPDFKKINTNEIILNNVDDFVSKITAKGDIRINYNIWSKFYKKDILNDIKFDEDISLAEDVLHTFAVAKKNPKTFVFNLKLYGYRNCQKSLSHGGYSVKQITHYTKCVKSVLDLFKNDDFHLNIIKKDFIPNILKHQIGRCRRASKANRPSMRHEFAKQIAFLNEMNLLDKKYHRKKMWKFISLISEGLIFKFSLLGITLFSVDLDGKPKLGK